MTTTPMRFTKNPLNRSMIHEDKKSPNFLRNIIETEIQQTGKWILYRSSKVYFFKSLPQVSLKHFSLSEIMKIVNKNSFEDFIHDFEERILVLGQGNFDSFWYFSVDISSLSNNDLALLSSSLLGNTVALDGRKLLTDCNSDDAALGGQIRSLYNFHNSNQYLGRTGEKTKSCEGGLKRVGMLSKENNKIYPRVDPVMIACVVSSDLKAVLLGNMKHHPKGFYSCLSGFIEPCESVQEAVVREVYEEAGVVIQTQDVYIIDSQPWPIGRFGGCELMIGCLAIAQTSTITIHDTEVVADARWFSKQEIEALLHKHSKSDLKTDLNQLNNEESCPESVRDIFIPADYAIAHHLLLRFAQHGYDMYCAKYVTAATTC